MATHHSENEPGKQFFLHVDPSVDNDDLEDFELSNCKIIIRNLFGRVLNGLLSIRSW